MNEGFFLSPDGVTITLEATHIATVIRQPEKFGLTRTAIDACYRKHREPIGLEGDAREEILLSVIRGGWTRVRNYRGVRSIQIPSKSAEFMERLSLFGGMALDGPQPFYGKVPASDLVKLTAIDTGHSVVITMGELAAGPISPEAKCLPFSSIDDYTLPSAR